MKQINIRVTDEEYRILEIIANRRGIPVTSLFRSVIYEEFDKWKIEELLNLYAEGNIRMKELLRLSGWSYAAILNKFSQMGLEPPTLKKAEKNAEEIARNLNRTAILKNPK